MLREWRHKTWTGKNIFIIYCVKGVVTRNIKKSENLIKNVQINKKW